jgi:hypothetical protein
VCSLISVADCSQTSFLSLIFIVIVPSIVSIHADLNWDGRPFFHFSAPRDFSNSRANPLFRNGTCWLCHIVFASSDWSFLMIIRYHGLSSGLDAIFPCFHCDLYEKCREPSDSMIVVFHNKNDKGKASDSSRWELSGYDFTIESDLGRVRSPRWKSKPNDANRSDPKNRSAEIFVTSEYSWAISATLPKSCPHLRVPLGKSRLLEYKNNAYSDWI